MRMLFRRLLNVVICFYLRAVKGVEFPDGRPLFIGWPIVARVRGARIAIGGDSLIVSNGRFNVAGVNHPTILAALTPESEIVIGRRCGLSGATLAARRSIRLGDFVALGVNVAIYDNDFHAEDFETRRRDPSANIATAAVSIAEGAWVGANAIVLKGVAIGERSVIGAGSVVTRSIGADVVAAGNPARELRPVKRGGA
jgi:acetyltransferase-like isoleucine patch superfamily enzyme